MTMLNAWRSDKAAYLLTDTAHYEDDGTVIEFSPKVVVHELAPAAFAFTGCGLHPGRFAEQIAIETLDAVELIRALPDVLRAHLAWADATDPEREHGFGVAAAIFNYDTERPEIWRCDTCHDWGAPQTFTAFNLSSAINSREVGGKEWGPGEMLGRPVDVTDELSFDPVKDGRILAEMQRKLPAPLPNGARGCLVGGQVVLTRVDMGGARHEVLVDWQDSIGRPIRA